MIPSTNTHWGRTPRHVPMYECQTCGAEWTPEEACGEELDQMPQCQTPGCDGILERI